jgi:hypothetical protein
MKTMTRLRMGLLGALLLACGPAMAQGTPEGAGGSGDFASVSIGRTRPAMETAFANPHPYHLEGRHWGPSPPSDNLFSKLLRVFKPRSLAEREEIARLADCEEARLRYEATGDLPEPGLGCGEKFYEYHGLNLITSVGKTAFSKAWSDTAAQPAAFNYLGFTNTAITPAVGDTTLAGEITGNGFYNGGVRWQATFADASAAIGTPPTPATPTTIGTTGAATLYYWVFACTNQGCTAVGTSSTLSTANATLSTANYVSVTWTGKLGASHNVVLRTQGAGAPSGAIAGGSTQATTGQVSNTPFCSVPVAGTAPTCTIYDQSNTTVAATFGPNGNSTTVPASDQTFIGKYTLTKTITATAAQSAQAFAVFNASTAGTMALIGTFPSATLATNDTLAFTETVYH